MYSVYALTDPRTNEIRYIGCTLDIQRRFKNHMDNKEGNAIKRAWIEDLKSQGLQPVLTILEGDLTEQDIHDREQRWIIKYRDEGAPLVNYQYCGPGRVYRKHKRIETSYVVFSEKQYKEYKALGRKVELRQFRQQSAG